MTEILIVALVIMVVLALGLGLYALLIASVGFFFTVGAAIAVDLFNLFGQ